MIQVAVFLFGCQFPSLWLGNTLGITGFPLSDNKSPRLPSSQFIAKEKSFSSLSGIDFFLFFLPLPEAILVIFIRRELTKNQSFFPLHAMARLVIPSS